MSIISFGGLATGLDTSSIITQLMNLERIPEQLLQAQQKTNTNKISEFQKIEDALTSLQTVVKGINTPGTFSTLKSSVADSSVLTATATSDASPGAHTVQVISLAKSQRQVSAGVASDTVLDFGTGSFTIDGGAPINIGAGQNSLKGIVAAINSSGSDVTASIINDGTNYRMVVTGTDTQNHTFDFSGLGTAPTLLGPPDPSYQAGADAQLVVDGINVTKTSNTITDAIQGVTLNLLTEGSTTTVSVTTDTDAVKQKINDFVTAYNKVRTLINSESVYNADTKTAGVLSGDSTVRTIQQQLRSLLTAAVPGVNGAIKSMADLGIKSDSKTGTLSVDSTKLSDALDDHYSDVVDYFTHNGDSVATLPAGQYGIAQQFNLVIETMVHPYISEGMADNGIIEVRKKGLAKINDDMDDRISDMEDRISQMQDNLQKQFTAMESIVSSLQSQGSMLTNYLNSLN
jgi:flagellar hook-associated protein 2